MNNATHVQNKKVLDRLRQGPVTSAELTRDLDILRPSARIYDLRGEGHKIVTAWDWDHVNGTDHRVGRYVLMKETGKIESPGESANSTRAISKNHKHILTEIFGTLLVAAIFSAIVLTAVFGASGIFDQPDSWTLAALLTAPGKRLPPYAKRLKDGAGRTLWICTGSDAWERAKSTTWMSGAKVVLPPGEDPEAYRWDLAGRFDDVCIVVDGQPPNMDIIKSLAIALMPHAELVIYLDPKRTPIRFIAGSGV